MFARYTKALAAMLIGLLLLPAAPALAQHHRHNRTGRILGAALLGAAVVGTSHHRRHRYSNPYYGSSYYDSYYDPGYGYRPYSRYGTYASPSYGFGTYVYSDYAINPVTHHQVDDAIHHSSEHHGHHW